MYTPKLNGRGFQKRANSALGMTLGCLTPDKPRALGKRFIDKHFGQSQNNISKWLREVLLICVSDSYNMETGQAKTYVYNPEGVKYISKCLDKEFKYTPNSTLNYSQQLEKNLHHIAVDWAETQFETDEFEYELKSNRYWNSLQNVKSSVRDEILCKYGIQFKYDIEAAAPTILYQYSRQIPLELDHRGRWLQGPNPLVLETLEYYLNNKSLVRKKIAHESELSVDVVKQIINALFAGAVLGNNPHTAIWDLVDGDTAVIEYLKTNPFVIGLKKDIHDMWEFIKPVIPFRQAVDKQTKQLKFNKDGTPRKAKLSSKDKWSVYFEQERRVLDEIRAYLEHPEVNTKYFLIHDGFYTNKPIDIQDLCYWIQAGTGYELMFDTGKDYYGLAAQAQHIQKPSVSSVHSSSKETGWFSGINWNTPEPLEKQEFYNKYGEYPNR